MKHRKEGNKDPQRRPHDKAGMAKETKFVTYKNYKADPNDFIADDMDRTKKGKGGKKSRGETLAEKMARIAKNN